MATSTNFVKEITELRQHYEEEYSDPKRKEMVHQLHGILQRHQQQHGGGGGGGSGAGGAASSPKTPDRTLKNPPAPDVVLPPKNVLPPPQGDIRADPRMTKDLERSRETHMKFVRWQQQRLKGMAGKAGAGAREGKDGPRCLRGPPPQEQDKRREEKRGAEGEQQGSSGLDSGLQPHFVEYQFTKDVWQHVNASTIRVKYCAGGGTSKSGAFANTPRCPFIDKAGAEAESTGKTKDGCVDLSLYREALGMTNGNGEGKHDSDRRDSARRSSSRRLSTHQPSSARGSVVLVPSKPSTPIKFKEQAQTTRQHRQLEEGEHRRRRSDTTSGTQHPPPEGTQEQQQRPTWFLTETDETAKAGSARLSRTQSPEGGGDGSRSSSFRVPVLPIGTKGSTTSALSSSVEQQLTPRRASLAAIRRPPVPMPWTCKVALHEVREIDSMAELRKRVMRQSRTRSRRGDDLSRLIPDPSPEMELVAKAIASSNEDFRAMIAYRPQNTSHRFKEISRRNRESKHRGHLDQHVHFEALVNEDRRQLLRIGADEIHRWVEDRTRLYDMKFSRMNLSEGTISWQRTLTRIRRTISTALEEEFSTERRELQDEFIMKFKKAFDIRFPVLSEEGARLMSIVEEMFRADAPFGAAQITTVIQELPLDYFLLPDVISLIFSLAMNLSLDERHWLQHIRQRTQFLDDTKKQSVTPPLPEEDAEMANAAWVLKLHPSQQNAKILRWAMGRTAAATLTKDDLNNLLRNAHLSVLIPTAIQMPPSEVHPDVVEGLIVMTSYQPWSREIAKMEDNAALHSWLKKCSSAHGKK